MDTALNLCVCVCVCVCLGLQLQQVQLIALSWPESWCVTADVDRKPDPIEGSTYTCPTGKVSLTNPGITTDDRLLRTARDFRTDVVCVPLRSLLSSPSHITITICIVRASATRKA